MERSKILNSLPGRHTFLHVPGVSISEGPILDYFVVSHAKHMLWILIETVLLSTQNIYARLLE